MTGQALFLRRLLPTSRLGELDILLLRIDERRHLIELQSVAFEITQRAILVGRARFANGNEKLGDRIEGGIGSASSGPKAHTLD
jgi:hypothetical protein